MMGVTMYVAANLYFDYQCIILCWHMRGVFIQWLMLDGMLRDYILVVYG